MVLLPSALYLLLSAAPVAAASDLVDLLDFDQGSVLVSEPRSYATGVDAWSAFHLADGSLKVGWASPQGVTGPAEFVWELDGDAEPKTLRVVTAGCEENKYAGVSGKTFELSAAAESGAFEKLGSFVVPRASQAEFPVSVKHPIRRVKLVVTENHGSPLYTEVMEVDLLGTKVGPARPPVDITGDYYSKRWNGLRMKQTGTHVDGCYDYADGVFSGELEGRVARVAWQESARGKVVSKGLATFVAVGASRIRGIYFREGSQSIAGTWDLEPASGPGQRARCQPAGGGMAAQLEREGRVVLYGIHFDVNKDVPRPDSGATLEELLRLLESNGALKLQIEGHTDSTNTDAFNQDLSERRAQAVVTWLTGRGIAATRLAARGFGRTRPVADNDTAQGRALNRRVELAPLAP